MARFTGLYSETPIVPDTPEVDVLDNKLNADVAERTLFLIDEVVELFKAPRRKEKKEKGPSGSLGSFIKRNLRLALAFVIFAGLAIGGTFDFVAQFTSYVFSTQSSFCFPAETSVSNLYSVHTNQLTSSSLANGMHASPFPDVFMFL
jgi:hypothetical protein